ncbi:MAG: TonB-dependent receptor plug domain-containing protein [Flavobacteriales bacterium]
MKKTIFIISICLMDVMITAQTVTVKDMVTSEPLTDVIIAGDNNVPPLVTNANGQADIVAMAGSSKITFSHVGYETAAFTPAQLTTMQHTVTLAPNSMFTPEVVVSASRFEERPEDVAQQVQVISRSDLRFMNQQTTADVLQHTGGVLVQKSQQGGGSPIIRGLEANKVLMVMDGVRMNNAIFRGGHLQNIITLDNSILDRVEIAYGPGSVVYGSDALGGVMHFYARNPNFNSDDSLLFHGNAYARTATSNNELSGHVDFNIGGRRFASLTSVTYSSFDDLRSGDLRAPGYDSFGRRYFYVERIDDKDSIIKNDNPNIQVGTGYKQYDVLQKFAFKQSDMIKHTLNFQLSSSTDIPRYDRLTEGTIDAPVNAVWYYGPQQRMMASYNLEMNNKNSLYDNARIILAYQQVEESRHNRGFDGGRQSNRMENVQVLSFNADFQKMTGRNELRYGTEVTSNDVQSEANREHATTGEITFQNTRYPDGGSKMNTAAIYLTDAFEVSESLVLNAGLRYSSVMLEAKIDSTNFAADAVINGDTLSYNFLNHTTLRQQNSAVNGSFGVVIKPGRGFNIALNAATGFRAPNVDDAGKLFEQPSGAVLIPNPDLKPEKSANLDLRISKMIDNKVNVQVTGFYNMIKNLIAVDSATYTNATVDELLVPSLTNVNKDEAYIYGLNAQIDARVNEHFGINSAINYTYGRIKGDTADTPLDHIPPVFGRTGFNYQTGKFRSEFFVMYNGWKRWENYRLGAEDNELYALTDQGMPGWYTLNLRAQYQANETVQVQLACENLLNHHYRVFASGTSSAGRNLMLTLRARF